MNSTLPLDLFVASVWGALIVVLVLAIGAAFNQIKHHSRKTNLRNLVRVYSNQTPKIFSKFAKGERLNMFLDSVTKYVSIPVPAIYRKSLVRSMDGLGTFDAKALSRLTALKSLLLIVGVLVGGYIGGSVGQAGVFVAISAGIFGYFVPDLWYYDRAVNRAQAIGYDLPAAIDLMYLSVSSGVSLNSAIQKVAENLRGPAAEELTRVLEEMRLGLSRPDAFRSLAARIKQPELIRFAEAMIKIDKLGISLTTVLAEQSREMRERRRTQAREKAQKVSVKILMPLVLCFLPGLFIIVLGPAILSIFNLFGK